MANKRALIVDDSTTAQYRLKKMLKAYALDIDVADSGEAALRYLATNVPDVVFMDHTMPGMDGLRALQVIKSHPETAVIPVIMYTAQSGDVYTGQARALGALDVVSKDKINATDLSKVMEAIHIYPIDKLEQNQSNNSTPKNNPAEKIEPKIERRSANAAAAEQIRNLDYRLSHLEHIQEDNRRFIVARILREIQGLRQTIKQEISNIPQPAQTISAPTPEVETSKSSGGFTFLLIVILLIMGFFLIHLTLQLNKNTENQILIQSELQALANKIPGSTNLPLQKTTQNQKSNYLSDLVWIFNQHAKLDFNQNNLDIKPLLALQDLLNRLTNSGFKGNALVTISVGNFCNTVNEMGEPQLAKPETHINNCIFSNEIYSIDKLVDEYSYQAHLIMNNIIQNDRANLTIIINAQEGKAPYPDRMLNATAGEWNRIAATNNRVDLVLLPE